MEQNHITVFTRVFPVNSGIKIVKQNMQHILHGSSIHSGGGVLINYSQIVDVLGEMMNDSPDAQEGTLRYWLDHQDFR